MRLNKKLFCFLFVMFITLICCCAVSAADDSDMETTATATATTSNDVVKDVESTSNVHSDEVTGSMDDTLQSDNNNEEAVNQNGVLDENNNLNEIVKAKIIGTDVKSANPIHSSGIYNLTENITVDQTVNLDGDLTINGNNYTITADNLEVLFNAQGHSIHLNNVIITGVTGYVIKGGQSHTFVLCEFINNGGIITSDQNQRFTSLKNCLIEGCTNVAFHFKIKTTMEICNCLFVYSGHELVDCWNHLTIQGYNFIVLNGVYELMNKTTAEDHEYSDNHHHGTGDIYFKYNNGITFNEMAKQFPTILTVIPEKNPVYINETNRVLVRLDANEDEDIRGAVTEKVTITITYTDGTTDETINLTDYKGEIYLNLVSEKKV